MASGFWTWLTSPAGNGNIDSTINMVEGMPPSAVNDSCRAMMSRLREYGNDITGSIVTSGTSTAFTVTTAQNFTTLAGMSGQIVAFTPHATSGTPATINVDGLGAKPLRTSSGVEIPNGILVAGTPYVALYNNSDGAFYLRDFYAIPYAVPIGMMGPYIVGTVPNSNFVFPFGQAISRTTYSVLFGLIGTSFGAGDGSTTFNIVDVRGRFIAGQDNMGGSAAGRITIAGGGFDGTLRGGTGGAETVTIAQANLPAATLATTITDPQHSHLIGVYNGAGSPGSAGVQGTGQAFNTSTGGGLALTGPTGITASTALGGSGTALNKMPPAMTLPYILRVI